MNKDYRLIISIEYDEYGDYTKETEKILDKIIRTCKQNNIEFSEFLDDEMDNENVTKIDLYTNMNESKLKKLFEKYDYDIELIKKF